MPKVPSIGLDQNQEGKFIDKYFGRVPKFTHIIREAGIYECNVEYVNLLVHVANGDITEDHVSHELWNEFADLMNKMMTPPAYRSIEENWLIRCFDEAMGNIITIPPGSGWSDYTSPCGILHVNDNGEGYVPFILSDGRNYVVNRFAHSGCIKGNIEYGIVCDENADCSCLLLHVYDNDEWIMRTLSLRGRHIRMSKTYQSCTQVGSGIPPGNDCGDEPCPPCLKAKVSRGIFVPAQYHNLAMDGAQYKFSLTYESCALAKEDIHYGKTCEETFCPDCLGLKVYHISTQSMRSFVLSDEEFFVSNVLESCAKLPVVKFGIDCSEPICPDCLRINMFDGYLQKMYPLVMDSNSVSCSRVFQSCSSILPPLFERTFTKFAPLGYTGVRMKSNYSNLVTEQFKVFIS